MRRSDCPRTGRLWEDRRVTSVDAPSGEHFRAGDASQSLVLLGFSGLEESSLGRQVWDSLQALQPLQLNYSAEWFVFASQPALPATRPVFPFSPGTLD